jgi:hypothetical protein
MSKYDIQVSALAKEMPLDRITAKIMIVRNLEMLEGLCALSVLNTLNVKVYSHDLANYVYEGNPYKALDGLERLAKMFLSPLT